MQFLGTHWENPAWLLMLPIVLLLCYACFQQRHAENNWQSICDPHLLTYLLIGDNNKKQQWPWALLAFAWLLACIALAGPSWHKKTIPSYRQQQAYIIIFDASEAMYSDDISPSRLVRARYKTIDLLQHLKAYQIGLLTFAGESYIVSPVTEDSHTIEHLVNTLSPDIMPVRGYQLSRALNHAQQLLQQANIKDGQFLVLTAGPVSPEAIKTAEKLHEDGIKISVLALGSEQGTPSKNSSGEYIKDQQGNIIINQRDTHGLKQLANAGGGHYAAFTADDQDIQKLFPNTQVLTNDKQQKSQSNQIIDWKNQGRLLIYPLLIIALVCFRRGWLIEVLTR